MPQVAIAHCGIVLEHVTERLLAGGEPEGMQHRHGTLERRLHFRIATGRKGRPCRADPRVSAPPALGQEQTGRQARRARKVDGREYSWRLLEVQAKGVSPTFYCALMAREVKYESRGGGTEQNIRHGLRNAGSALMGHVLPGHRRPSAAGLPTPHLRRLAGGSGRGAGPMTRHVVQRPAVTARQPDRCDSIRRRTAMPKDLRPPRVGGGKVTAACRAARRPG